LDLVFFPTRPEGKKEKEKDDATNGWAPQELPTNSADVWVFDDHGPSPMVGTTIKGLGLSFMVI
jgi:hypothetical protein